MPIARPGRRSSRPRRSARRSRANRACRSWFSRRAAASPTAALPHELCYSVARGGDDVPGRDPLSRTVPLRAGGAARGASAATSRVAGGAAGRGAGRAAGGAAGGADPFGVVGCAPGLGAGAPGDGRGCAALLLPGAGRGGAGGRAPGRGPALAGGGTPIIGLPVIEPGSIGAGRDSGALPGHPLVVPGRFASGAKASRPPGRETWRRGPGSGVQTCGPRLLTITVLLLMTMLRSCQFGPRPCQIQGGAPTGRPHPMPGPHPGPQPGTQPGGRCQGGGAQTQRGGVAHHQLP